MDLFQQLEALIKPFDFAQGRQFLRRLKKGNLTRDENPISHFCVYFPAFDPAVGEIFLGHHKKSGLWLVNGGHIDKGELLKETLEREMKEEWGIVMPLRRPLRPDLLTLTKIVSNPAKRSCRYHYDIWFFIKVNKKKFKPDPKLLAEEFFETKWLSLTAAKKIVIDPNTLSAIKFLEKEAKS